MEIGGPTDVKHVAHIGMDGSSGSAPSWVRNHISRIGLSSDESKSVKYRVINHFT